MLTLKELQEITGVARFQAIGQTAEDLTRRGGRGGIVGRAVLFRHTLVPPAPPVGVLVFGISPTEVELLCDAAYAPAAGEAFSVGIERNDGAVRVPLWFVCDTVSSTPTGWSNRARVAARFAARTTAPKYTAPPPAPPPRAASVAAPLPPPPDAFGGPLAFEAVFEQYPHGLALVTLDHRLARVNRAFCEITGYPAAELANLTFDDITHADDIGLDLQLVARLFSGEVARYEMNKRYIHKDGHAVPVELTAALFRDARGAVAGAISTVRRLDPAAAASPGARGTTATATATATAVATAVEPEPNAPQPDLDRLRRAILD